MKLPTPPPADCLINIWQSFIGFEFTAPDAKICIVNGDFLAFNKNNTNVGKLVYETKSDDYCLFIYVDKNVTITGEDEDGGAVNITLTKGWNNLYNGSTTKPVSGMKWYFTKNSAYDDDDDDGGGGGGDATGFKITATVENGSAYNSKISTVKAMAEDYTTDTEAVLASGNYSNGGFIITLPTTPAVKYLGQMVSPNITVSDPGAKFCIVEPLFEAYKGANSVGDLCYAKEGNSSVIFGMYMYADRDVTIDGKESGGGVNVTFNLSLKKGWNIIYNTYSPYDNSQSLSSTVVSGLKWYFEENENDYKKSSICSHFQSRRWLK
jgi:hypothetical protein